MDQYSGPELDEGHPSWTGLLYRPDQSAMWWSADVIVCLSLGRLCLDSHPGVHKRALHTHTHTHTHTPRHGREHTGKNVAQRPAVSFVAVPLGLRQAPDERPFIRLDANKLTDVQTTSGKVKS